MGLLLLKIGALLAVFGITLTNIKRVKGDWDVYSFKLAYAFILFGAILAASGT